MINDPGQFRKDRANIGRMSAGRRQHNWFCYVLSHGWRLRFSLLLRDWPPWHAKLASNHLHRQSCGASEDLVLGNSWHCNSITTALQQHCGASAALLDHLQPSSKGAATSNSSNSPPRVVGFRYPNTCRRSVSICTCVHLCACKAIAKCKITRKQDRIQQT